MENSPTRAVTALGTDAVRVTPLGKESLVMTGADRVRFLNGVVTANVAETPVGGGVQALSAHAQGAHRLRDARVRARRNS